MELRKSFGFQKVLAAICFLVAVFCFARGLESAEAASYEISANLSIPSIGLSTDVTKLQLKEHELQTPDEIVGSFSRVKNKTLLIGHSTTVFKSLDNITVGDKINYDHNEYVVNNVAILKKANINMDKILKAEKVDTIVLMTCIGELYNNGDASHRLIITAISE